MTLGITDESNTTQLESEQAPPMRIMSSTIPSHESLLNKCAWARVVTKQPDKASVDECGLLAGLLGQSLLGKQIALNVFERREKAIPDTPTLEDCVPLGTPSCAQIHAASEGRHCGRCDYLDVVKSPSRLGSAPFNTNKRDVVITKQLDQEILITEAILAYYSDVYNCGGQLVRLVENRLKKASVDGRFPLEIRPISQSTLRELLCKVLAFISLDGGEAKGVYPPRDLLNALLDRGHYPSLKQIHSVTQVPVLCPDGSVLQQSGHDATSGLFFDPQREYPRVPENPTPGDIQAALGLLLEVIHDFPFVDDVGRAVYLATVLTTIGRMAFDGCVPMVLIDANSPGVGKTKLADICGLITTGYSLPRTTQATNHEEERRRITALLRQGGRFLLIDNVATRLGSTTLDALLTSEVWQDRILRRSEVQTFPNLLQVIATGNNLQLKADTVRRCLRIQLKAAEERPEARSDFRHPNLEAWVSERQPELLVAALTLLRGYIAAGQPPQDIVTLGSFEGWSGLIQSTVKWAYGVDPGESRILEEDQMDLEKEILDTLMRGWRGIVPDGRAITCRELMKILPEKGDYGQDILDALEMAGPGKVSAVRLGHLLTRMKDRSYHGIHFERGANKTRDGVVWKLTTS